MEKLMYQIFKIQIMHFLDSVLHLNPARHLSWVFGLNCPKSSLSERRAIQKGTHQYST